MSINTLLDLLICLIDNEYCNLVYTIVGIFTCVLHMIVWVYLNTCVEYWKCIALPVVHVDIINVSI